jgi:signal transduction histidine kinase
METEHRFQAITADGDLELRGVSGIAERANGDLWLSTNSGIVRILGAEVERVIANPAYRVHYGLFDAADGLLGKPVQFHPGSTMVEGTDGQLWFLTSGGIARIDPEHLVRNTIPPTVLVRSVESGGRAYWSSGIKLPPGTKDLHIEFTATSLAAPERVRFRYKLEGYREGWQDAGTRREAFYTNMGPGDYRFRVIACNNDGVWNEAGATWDLSIAPAFYQTYGFRSLYVLAGSALLWLLVHLRLRQMTARMDLRYTERLAERTRIARDLHDTLLQSFQGLMLRLQVVDDLLPEGKAKAQLDQALERADQAIAEGRSAVYDLRSHVTGTNDLAQALRSLGEELATSNSATFHLAVEGTPKDLQPIIRDEIWRIGGEAIRNAFSHADAHHIEAGISYGKRSFQLRIRDDGKGIPPEVLKKGRCGHYGLNGIRERAKQVGGRLDILSRPGAGAEIELSVANSIAYRARERQPFWRFFRKEKDTA